MSVRGMLNDTCNASKQAETIGSHGNPEVTLSAALSSVACTLQLTDTTELEEQFREAGQRQGDLYVEHGTDIGIGYVLSGFTISPQSGLVFSVVGPPTDDCGRGIYYRIPVQQVTARTAGER